MANDMQGVVNVTLLDQDLSIIQFLRGRNGGQLSALIGGQVID